MAQAQQVGKPKVARLPLMGAYSNRGSSSTKDQRFVNIFPETRKVEQLENTKIFLNKRPGLDLYKNYGAGAGRGITYFNNKFYVAVGNIVWEDAVTPVAKITLTGSTGPLNITQANSSTLGDYIFICDGTDGWTIDTAGTVTHITSTSIYNATVDSPGSGFTPGTYAATFTGGGGSGAAATYTVTGTTVAYITVTTYGTGYTSAPTITFPLGGGTGATGLVTLNSFPTPHIPSATFIDGYVVLAKGSDVYTCDLDNPHRWSSNNYLSAEMFPDPVKAISRQNNQVCVLGGNSIEFFYDAANASGSPLSRNDSTTIQMGTCAPYAVIGNEKFIFYLSQSDSGGRAAWLIDGFQPKKVSDEYIERILDAETNMEDVSGFGLRTKGHLFYFVNLKSQGRTLVYDSDEKLWHEWSTNVADTHTTFNCDKMADNASGMSYLLAATGGDVYKLNPNTYTDNGNAINLELVTNKYDMDTYYRKFLSSVKIVGDRYETGNQITLQWTDDDYQTWSNAKTITMTDDFPAFHRLGAFRRRAFRFKHNLNYGLRLESLECVYVEGSS